MEDAMDIRSMLGWASVSLLLGGVVAFGVVQTLSPANNDSDRSVSVAVVQLPATEVPTAIPSITLVPLIAPATPQPTEEPTGAPVAPTTIPATTTSAPTVVAQAVPTTKVPPATPAFIEYTVQKGDILARIAMRHNVSVEAILQANNISDPDSLSVGDVLWIPQV